MVRKVLLVPTVTLLMLAATVAYAPLPPSPQNSSTNRVDQGCVNQGSDSRMAAPVVCWLQRKLSWKSEHSPRLRYVGNPRKSHVAVAWPPYLVYNSPEKDGSWRMFRIGFRYDRTWRGYIFPTIAVKRLPLPLTY